MYFRKKIMKSIQICGNLVTNIQVSCGILLHLLASPDANYGLIIPTVQIHLPLWLRGTQETENNHRREKFRLQVFLPMFGFLQIGFQRSFCSWSHMEQQAAQAQPVFVLPQVSFPVCAQAQGRQVWLKCVLHSVLDSWKGTMDTGSWEAQAEHQASPTSRTHGTYLAQRTLQNQFLLKGSILSFIVVVVFQCGETHLTWDLPSTKVYVHSIVLLTVGTMLRFHLAGQTLSTLNSNLLAPPHPHSATGNHHSSACCLVVARS